MPTEYAPRNSQLSPTKAQRYGEALAALMKKHRVLDPEVIVRAAEPEDSPLHDAFEWDDARAAHANRLNQARKLVKTIVVVSTGEPLVIHTHARVAPREDGAPGEETPQYAPTRVVLRTPDLRANAKVSLLRRLRGYCLELRLYEELHGLADQIEEECARAEAEWDDACAAPAEQVA